MAQLFLMSWIRSFGLTITGLQIITPLTHPRKDVLVFGIKVRLVFIVQPGGGVGFDFITCDLFAHALENDFPG